MSERTEQQQEVIDLLKANLQDTVTGDLWPWLQTLSAVIFIVGILVMPDNANDVYGWLLFITFCIFNVYAMYQTYKEESGENVKK